MAKDERKPDTHDSGGTADVSDAEWVKTQDLHTGDEAGEPERTEAKLESVDKQQPEHGIGDDQIARLHEVEENKRQASREASERTQSTDFEQAEEGEPVLQAGVGAQQAFDERERVQARMRRESGYLQDNDEVVKRDRELLGD